MHLNLLFLNLSSFLSVQTKYRAQLLGSANVPSSRHSNFTFSFGVTGSTCGARGSTGATGGNTAFSSSGPFVHSSSPVSSGSSASSERPATMNAQRPRNWLNTWPSGHWRPYCR
uniref:Putative secreted protein n=1 Tax=Anopheles darlingi TaxID=43151 RepID=A0A2M4D979_ANODA